MNDKIKISKEELIEMIKEELSEVDQDLRKAGTVSDTEAGKGMRAASRELGGQKGITTIERGVIKNFVDTLTAYADVANLKSGNVFAILNKLSSKMAAATEKAKGQQDEE